MQELILHGSEQLYPLSSMSRILLHVIHTNIQRISPWQKPWKISKPAWAELSVVFVTSCLTFPYKGHSFYKRRRWFLSTVMRGDDFYSFIFSRLRKLFSRKNYFNNIINFTFIFDKKLTKSRPKEKAFNNSFDVVFFDKSQQMIGVTQRSP